MRFLRSFHESPLLPDPDPARDVRIVTALESATVAVVALEEGDTATAVRASDAHQLLFILEGAVTVDVGDRPAQAAVHTLVHVPSGVPLRVANPGPGRAEYLLLAVPGIAPGHPRDALVAELDHTPGRLGGEPLARRIDRGGFADGQRPNGFAVQTLAGPDDGVSGCTVNVASVAAGGAGPQMHIHTFDQLFVILSGRLTVAVADEQLDAEPGQVVVLPAGVPHTQWNEGTEPELHLAVLLPGPAPGEPITIPVTFDVADREPRPGG